MIGHVVQVTVSRAKKLILWCISEAFQFPVTMFEQHILSGGIIWISLSAGLSGMEAFNECNYI